MSERNSQEISTFFAYPTEKTEEEETGRVGLDKENKHLDFCVLHVRSQCTNGDIENFGYMHLKYRGEVQLETNISVSSVCK